MKVYNYHPDYNYYLYESDADPSPLEAGVFLIPAHATASKPPTCEEGRIQVFDEYNFIWRIIEDKRGTYYSIEDGQLIENPNPSAEPNNTTKLEPPFLQDGETFSWNGVSWDLNPPFQMDELTPEQKLSNAGLTVDELRTLLGL